MVRRFDSRYNMAATEPVGSNDIKILFLYCWAPSGVNKFRLSCSKGS
jgi:hypothetical protein